MIRMCDAALVASFLAVAPVLAGTPIAKSKGMEMPVTVVTVKPELAVPATAAPVVPATPAAPAPGAAAAPAGEPSFEALIADFRWGWPEMGAEPHLPIPPPHRMRAEEPATSGEDTPVDGNSGNALPLHLLSLPQPAPAEGEKLPANAPGAPPPGPATQGPSTAPPAERAAPPAATSPLASASTPNSIHDAAAPAPSDVDPATLEQMMQKLATASAGEFNSPVTARESRHAPAEQRAASSAENRSAAAAAAQALPAGTQSASSHAAAASGFASSFERAIASANADARARGTRVSLLPANRAAVTNELRAGEPRTTAESAFSASLESLRVSTEGREGFSGSLLRDAVRTQGDAGTTPSAQAFTLPSAASPAQTAAAATPQGTSQVLDLRTPVQQPEWAQSLGEKVVMLTQSDANSAQIRLNPAHLGPVEVQVSIEQDQASVSFVAQHAVTREALEAAAPRLREMLQSQGFGNVNVDISQHSAGHRAAHEQRPERNVPWQQAQLEEKPDAGYANSRNTARSTSALDTFA